MLDIDSGRPIQGEKAKVKASVYNIGDKHIWFPVFEDFFSNKWGGFKKYDTLHVNQDVPRISFRESEIIFEERE